MVKSSSPMFEQGEPVVFGGLKGELKAPAFKMH